MFLRSHLRHKEGYQEPLLLLTPSPGGAAEAGGWQLTREHVLDAVIVSEAVGCPG